MKKWFLLTMLLTLSACTIKQNNGEQAESAAQTLCLAKIQEQVPQSATIEKGSEYTVKVQGRSTTTAEYTIEADGGKREATCKVEDQDGQQTATVEWKN